MSIAIIGGSGFAELNHFDFHTSLQIDTIYGQTSTAIQQGSFDYEGKQYGDIFFLARHGDKHSIQPHQINYRANIDALSQLGVTKIIALAAVGSLDENIPPGKLVLPHQILDYTYGREMTFFDKVGDVAHAEFTAPYSAEMRDAFIDVSRIIKSESESNSESANNIVTEGVYAVTQGPRFESAAEIQRYARDGATLVGMTAMPEAVLAREKGIAYMTVASVVNYAAGVQEGVISHEDIYAAYTKASDSLYSIIKPALKKIESVTVDVPELIYP